ncbi:uncharacterized protein LOC135296223 isoform X7 [Passer domesticus]|uniref:uncharacterized protein LOC135296223 isoform X7 n=1 Tax=Passer domesticus TaxID=48849 RepID=UPI0030FE0B2B
MPSKLRGFSHPDVCWESCTMSCRQSRRLLENMEDNFLTQKGSDTAPLVGICHPAKLNSPQGSSGFDEVLFGYTQEFTQLKQNQQILQVIETYSTHTDNLTTDFLGPNHIPGEGRQSKRLSIQKKKPPKKTLKNKTKQQQQQPKKKTTYTHTQKTPDRTTEDYFSNRSVNTKILKC